MDRRLKERLVGAAVLVALGVALIPWILDGPDADVEEPSNEIALRLPLPQNGNVGVDTPIRQRTIEIGADAVGTDMSVSSVSEPAATSLPAEIDSLPQRENSEQVVEIAPEPASAVTPAPTVTEAARDQAAPDNVEIIVAADFPPTKGWMIQLGSFGDRGNAKRQADRIKTFGHTPQIFEFSAGDRTMYRVRLGPVDTRDRAEATASSLAAHGFVAQLVAPE